MKLSNYNEKKAVIPVQGGLSVTPQKFAMMSYDSQKSLISHNEHQGNPGTVNPTWDIPPTSLRGITANELVDEMEDFEYRLQDAAKRKSSKLSKAQRQQKLLDQIQKEQNK